MVKSVIRFLLVLIVAFLVGATLYFVMHHFIQPLADRLDPEPFEVITVETEPSPIELPDLSDLFHESFSVAKNGIVFVVMTILILVVQQVVPKLKSMLKSEE